MKTPRDRTGVAPPGGIRRVAEVIAVLFLLLGGDSPAAAQDIRLFQIENIGGTVELGFLTDLQDRERSRSSNSDFDRVELSQLVHLNSQGYIYHPRFLTFDVGAEFEAIEGLAGQSDTRILGGGDWRFNFLEEHRNSLSIYGTILDSEYQRPFSETYDITDELYAATFYQKWGWVPFDLTYHHRERSGGLDDQLDESVDKVIFNGSYQLGRQSEGRLEYDLAYEDIQDRDIRRQNAVVTNVSRIGEGADKTVRTNLWFLEERDGRQLYYLNGRTDFDWKHTDHLRTRYILDGRWNDSGVQDTTNLNPSFFLTHQLYDSLRSHLEIFGRFEDASFRERDEFGARLAEDYLKRLGDWGRLNISVSPHASMIYNRLDEDTAFVFDERHVMIGLQPVQLRRADIIESSIVVTNESKSIVYDEGPLGDYIVNQVVGGLETELVRTPTSNIADGQVVLVDYEFELAGEGDMLPWGVNVYSSLLLFDHWSVFGRYDTVDHHVFSGDEDDIRFNDFDHYVVGSEFAWSWFDAKAEYEDKDATFGPYWGYSGAVSFFTSGVGTWNARFNADYAYRNHTDDDGDTVKRFSISGNASRRFFSQGLLEAEGSWLRGRWSGQSSEANDIDAVHVKLKYSWWYGKVEFKLETGFAQLLRPTEDRSVYKVDLRVRRVF